MRAADLLLEPVKKYRLSINPPYKRKDLISILGTLFILLAIPLTVFVALKVRPWGPRAAGTAAAPTTIGSVVEPGSMVSGASYIVFAEGTNYYAKDGKTGEIKFSGSGDATPVIQAAIDALPAGGGKVVLTEGTFQLPTRAVLLKSRVVLEGQGYTTLIQYNGDTIAGVMAIGSYNGIEVRKDIADSTVRNLRIKNTGTSIGAPGVFIGWWNEGGSQHITLDNLECENCNLWILGGSHHRVEHNYIHDMTIDDMGRAIAVGGQGADWVHDAIIANNIINNVPDMGIQTALGNGIVIADNKIADCAKTADPKYEGFAIDTSNTTNVLITGNNIKSKHGILSENADAGTVQITDNTIKGTGLTGGTGIQVWRHTDTGPTGPQADRILISGNTVHNVHFGIYVFGEDILSIVGNLVEDVGQPGIAVDGAWGIDFSDILISGNTVIRWARNNSYAPGIGVSSANALITGNYLDQENFNFGRGITSVDNPSWIINNTIRNCAGERIYDVEAGVVNEHNY